MKNIFHGTCYGIFVRLYHILRTRIIKSIPAISKIQFIPIILRILVILIIPVILIHASYPQEGSIIPNCPDSTARVVFYNVENLFHPSNDSLRNDDGFTPSGDHHWTYTRYKKKLDNIGRCLAMTGIREPPAIIGLAEIENKLVLKDLATKTILSGKKYGIIHKDSPDARGIDVGMLYDPEKFDPESYELISVDTSRHHLLTREMLYVKGLLFRSVPIHFFVVHWPSRRGGQIGSEKNRILVAGLLREKIRSILENDSLANILIMGDFNDNPEDQSLREGLDAVRPSGLDRNHPMINLMFDLADRNEGSYLHLHNFAEWDNLDQVIVSGSLYLGHAGLIVAGGKAMIFRKPWLLDSDGLKLFSTFRGFRYAGGFSDHLPVYVDIVQF